MLKDRGNVFDLCRVVRVHTQVLQFSQPWLILLPISHSLHSLLLQMLTLLGSWVSSCHCFCWTCALFTVCLLTLGSFSDQMQPRVGSPAEKISYLSCALWDLKVPFNNCLHLYAENQVCVCVFLPSLWTEMHQPFTSWRWAHSPFLSAASSSSSSFSPSSPSRRHSGKLSVNSL